MCLNKCNKKCVLIISQLEYMLKNIFKYLLFIGKQDYHVFTN